ncbi:MAG TPA: hypothetical protein VGD14_03245, partial [bacterium]
MKKSMLVVWCCIGAILLISVKSLFAQTYLNTTLVGEARAGGFSDVAVSGEYAYVVYKNSIDIFGIKDLSSSVYINSQPILFPVQSLTISGRYLFVGGTGLQVFDLEDPIHLKALGAYTLSSASPANKIRLYGTKAFICQQTRLSILDFIDPNHLQL